MNKVKGKCLCGAVSVSFPLERKGFDACHCGMCRKWGGGPALTVDGGGKIEFTGADNISTYRSSEWAERGFCKRCGTHLFYKFVETGFHNFPLGLIEDSEDLRFLLQIFVDRKPAQYNFAEKTEVMTEAQVFAKHINPRA